MFLFYTIWQFWKTLIIWLLFWLCRNFKRAQGSEQLHCVFLVKLPTQLHVRRKRLFPSSFLVFLLEIFFSELRASRGGGHWGNFPCIALILRQGTFVRKISHWPKLPMPDILMITKDPSSTSAIYIFFKTESPTASCLQLFYVVLK